MTLMQFHFYSECLEMETEAWVSLPHAAAMGPDGFKTIWLYHGGGSNHTSWLRETEAEALAEAHGYAIVMPNSLNSCFIDMNQGEKFGTFVGKELVERIRGYLPCLSAKREDNVVSGFSDGGYGCLIAGLTYPETFGCIAGFAAGDKADADFSYRMEQKIRLFGPDDFQETPYSVKYLARQLAADGSRPKPRIFHACGEFDAWRGMNEQVRDCILGLDGDPYQYEYHLVDGMKHEWAFCQEAMKYFLEEYQK